MARTAWSAAIVLVALVSATPTLQTPPDLSGRWTVQAEPAPATPAAGAALPRGDMGSGWGSPITITQDARQFVVEQALFSRYDLQPPVRSVFLLDGSESRNALMIGHTTQVRTSRAAWEGTTLRISTVYPSIDPASGKMFTTEVTHRLSLESPAALVVNVTRSSPLGGGETTTRTVYRKN